MEYVVEVNNLTKKYKNNRGIFDFNFKVRKGTVFGIVGTNGSGKTTTLRNMMGFIKPNSGTIKINGLDAWKDASKIKKIVGYVPGQIDFPDIGTGDAFLKSQAELLGLKNFTVMNELIDKFKIDIKAPLKRMSKGMKQKMALVVAFMTDADIYLLDEPSTGLDPLMRDTLIEIIQKKKKEGKTVILSSHIFKELEDTCDDVLFIKNGKMINLVSREEYNQNPCENYEIRFNKESDYIDFINSDIMKIDNKEDELYLINKYDEQFEATIRASKKELNKLFNKLKQYDLESINHVSYTLEKYYIEMIESEEFKNV